MTLKTVSMSSLKSKMRSVNIRILISQHSFKIFLFYLFIYNIHQFLINFSLFSKTATSTQNTMLIWMTWSSRKTAPIWQVRTNHSTGTVPIWQVRTNHSTGTMPYISFICYKVLCIKSFCLYFFNIKPNTATVSLTLIEIM